MEQILEEARRLEALGALGFCLVTAQKGLDDKTLEFVCNVTCKGAPCFHTANHKGTTVNIEYYFVSRIFRL